MPKTGKLKFEKLKEKPEIQTGDKKPEKKEYPEKKVEKLFITNKEKKKEKLVQKNKKELHQIAEEAEKKLNKKQHA